MFSTVLDAVVIVRAKAPYCPIMIAYKREGEEKGKTMVGNNIKCEGEITSKLVTKYGLIKNTENRPCGGTRDVVKQARLNAS